MNPDAKREIADLDLELAEVGQTVTLQRMTTDNDGAQTPFPVACLAVVKLKEPSDLAQAAGDAPDTEVILSPTPLMKANWPGVGLPPLPRRDDQVIDVRGFKMNVEAVMPYDVGGQIVRIELRCRGVQDNS